MNHKIGLKNQRDIKLFSRGKSVSYRVDPSSSSVHKEAGNAFRLEWNCKNQAKQNSEPTDLH